MHSLPGMVWTNSHLHTVTVEQLCTDVLEEGPYLNLIDLSAARDFSTEATINGELLYKTIQNKIFRMTFNPIAKTLFEQICTNFWTKPQAHIERVNMITLDPDGNKIIMSVDSYNLSF